MLENTDPIVLDISGPYGVGKDTMLHAILSTFGEKVKRVGTVTTRPSNPIADPSFRSVSEEELAIITAQGRWVVNRQVGGFAYATSVDEIEREAAEGKISILTVYSSPAGIGRMREEFGNKLFAVGLLAKAGSREDQIAELQRRMVERSRDDAATIQRRSTTQGDQIDYILQNPSIATPDGQLPVFDHILLNEDVDIATTELLTLVRSRFTKIV